MRKLLLTIAGMFLLLGAMAQQVPLIEVEGKSEISIQPDEVLIYLNMSQKGRTSAEATNELNKRMRTLEQALKKTGVQTYELFVENYTVNLDRIYKDGTYQDIGFIASQMARVRVSDTQKDLAKVIEALHTSVESGFNLQFQVSEKAMKASQEKLLQMALEDARTKAEIIAKTMGIAEIKVFKVQYSTQDKGFSPVMRSMKTMAMDASIAYEEPVLQTEAKKITDSVLVSFAFMN
ncbi:SIMPL domain-containing protein [Mongoliitalea daihaiensis]|uniref:SIMPL domain-containing protein n=1 Tax=Mongoliitalea daihaiensis TaxID=2782006 RepID=UPI001F431260|nr:SIMPL domain-containing protein [Mongoliitalea daihaiensis]UJP64671.1 SIMPL domain-containing protein [Mongoliitalea daihaiensis]